MLISPGLTSRTDGSTVCIFALMYISLPEAYTGAHICIVLYKCKMILATQVRHLANLI